MHTSCLQFIFILRIFKINIKTNGVSEKLISESVLMRIGLKNNSMGQNSPVFVQTTFDLKQADYP